MQWNQIFQWGVYKQSLVHQIQHNYTHCFLSCSLIIKVLQPNYFDDFKIISASITMDYLLYSFMHVTKLWNAEYKTVLTDFIITDFV